MPRPGSAQIWFEELGPDDADKLNAFHNLYIRSFPLPDEQEPLEGFLYVLRANRDTLLQRQFGPYHEAVALIRMHPENEIIGGLVFSVATSPDHLAAGYAASVQAIYVFVKPESRGVLCRSLVADYLVRRATEIFPPDPDGTTTEGRPSDVAVFFEVNNPLRMDPEDIQSDEDLSGLNPWRRYKAWLSIGGVPLDFDYVQPPLSPDKEPVHYLDLFYLADSRPAVPSPVLLRHLRSFVSISVLKGRDAETDPAFRAMKAELCACDRVEFVPPQDKGRRQIEQTAQSMRGRRAARPGGPPPLFSKPVESLTADDVLAVIGWPESVTVELKRDLPSPGNRPDAWMTGGNSEKYAREKLFKEVVAFANTGGGHLLLGIAETRERPPVAADILPIPRCAALAEQLSDAAQGTIDPPIPQLLIQGVPTRPDGSGVVVFRVPASDHMPHRAPDRECYERRGTSSVPMTMYEIQQKAVEAARRRHA